MPTDLVYPDEIDARLKWPPGRTSQLSRRGKLPHYRLPDGSVRLRWAEVEPLVRHIRTAELPDPPLLLAALIRARQDGNRQAEAVARSELVGLGIQVAFGDELTAPEHATPSTR